MALEVATYINGLNTANPVGADPLAQADDHLRLIKTAIKNTFPNIDGPVTLTDDQINALETRVDTLEAGGGIGGTTGGISSVSTLPATGSYVGETVYLTADGRLYSWDGTAWIALTQPNQTPDVPAAIEIVDGLPTTATDGDVVFNKVDNKLYERVNGAWTEVVITVNASQEVADASITVAKFAQGIRPIEIVSTLPTVGNSEGRMVYLTTDDKIYRYTGAAFTTGMPFGDLTGTIAAGQIAANTITAGKIAVGAIGADQIAAGAISTAKLAAGAVTASTIAAGAISADKIATNAITSDKISANSITSGKIAAAAIGTTQLAAGAITAASAVIANAAVGTLQIAGNSVTQAAAVHVPLQQEVNSTTYQSIATTTVSVSGTQPILVWASLGMAGARLGTSTDYDIFFEGNYWKTNTLLTDGIFQFKIGNTGSGDIASYTVVNGITGSASVAYVFTGVPAGTYSLSIQARKLEAGQQNWGARKVTLAFMETKR